MIEYPKLFIGGRWVDPATDRMVTVRSPHDHSIAGRVAEASEVDVDRAVAAARDAFDTGPWPRLPLEERQAILSRFSNDHAARSEEFARLVTAENGSPLWYTRALHHYIPQQNSSYLNAASAFPWEEVREAVPEGRTLVRHEPIGVVAAVIPWNAPHQSALVKLFPALLAGCTVILKLAPETAVDGQVLGDLLNDAGLPEGVVSILAADRPISEYLIGHPGIDKIAFTGSTAAGLRIASIAGGTLKRVSLELGGKSACIVLDDAPCAEVVGALRYSAFMNTGQVCVAQTRILVPRRMHDSFTDALVAEVETMKIGDPADEDTFLGPLVAERQRVRVEDYIRLGQAEGARVATGGVGRPSGISEGAYVRPTVFANAGSDMRITREEIFGPVVAVIPYDTVEQAVVIANDSSFGLSGGVWSADADRAQDVATQLRTGMVSINGSGPDFAAPFGGYKHSGIGREMGSFGIAQYTELKSIMF